MRALVIVGILTAPLLADSLAAYGERSWKSPTGAFVIETKGVAGGKIDFVIKSNKGRVRGKGRIDHMPLELVLFDDGTGFVVWGRYMRDARGVAVARYDFDGTLRWKHDFKALFDKAQIDGFRKTLSMVLWARSIWNDPTRGELIGTTTTRLVLRFNTQTGKVRPGGMDAVLDSLKLKPPPLAGIEAAGEWYPDRAREALVAIARDEEIGVRLRVTAAHLSGRKGDYARLWNDALDDAAALPRAVKAASTVLPREDALEFLERAALHKRVAFAAIGQLAALGATAQLVTVLAHGDTPPDARTAAGKTLHKLPAAEVVKGVLKEFDDADGETAAVMLDVLIAVGGKSLPRSLQPHQQKLIQLLDRKSANAVWLAGYFTQVPTTEAVPGLLRVARRLSGKRADQKVVFGALRKCTGLQVGNNLNDWERALKR